MNRLDLISLREYKPEDKNFIMATWLKGLYYGESGFSDMKKDTFMRSYHEILEKLITRPEVSIYIACLKEDPEVILGYAVLTQKTAAVHWVFVKSAWRDIGIAKSLFPQHTKVVTHLTKVGRNIIKKQHPGVEFNPFALVG